MRQAVILQQKAGTQIPAISEKGDSAAFFYAWRFTFRFSFRARVLCLTFMRLERPLFAKLIGAEQEPFWHGLVQR